MSKQKQPTFQAQAEQQIKDDALTIAKGIQTPDQTKEQTKLIAKGIEKGIALYKRQEKEKARERAKFRKKRDKQINGNNQTHPATNAATELTAPSKNLRLATAGLIFLVVSVLHVIRYLFGLTLIIGDYDVPLFWSLPAAAVSAALALWLFWSLRAGAAGRE